MKTIPPPTDRSLSLDFLSPESRPSLEVRTILVPTDLKERHIKTVWFAAQLAQKWGAKLKLLHVYHNPASISCSRPTHGTYHCEEYRSAKVSALQELCRQVKESYPDCEAYFTEGYPPDEIGRYAKHLHADLLILSQNLRVPGVLGLSETPAIIREAGIPALILPN
jgi:nucleotide-binding universal stress UspA family protein